MHRKQRHIEKWNKIIILDDKCKCIHQYELNHQGRLVEIFQKPYKHKIIEKIRTQNASDNFEILSSKATDNIKTKSHAFDIDLDFFNDQDDSTFDVLCNFPMIGNEKLDSS